jgi:hypothetical protein
MNLKHLQCGRNMIVFRALPTKSLAVKGEKCDRGQNAQERFRVLLCGNMVGEMEKQQNQDVSRT